MSLRGACAIALGGAVPLFLFFVACGDRTQLGDLDFPNDASKGRADGSRADASLDANGQVDGTTPDAPSDVAIDAPDDAIDDVLPGLDARPLRDAEPLFCADAAATLVYAVTESNEVLRFDPPSVTFSVIGTLDCNDPNAAFSMAVDRQGVAYVLFANYSADTPGSVYRASLVNAACVKTAYVPGQLGYNAFGMGFSADTIDEGETLYVASSIPDAGSQLGTIDVKSLTLSSIGAFSPPIAEPELTGTGDGRLFAFYSTNPERTSSAIAEIDKSSGKVVASDALVGLAQGDAWAFGFWGGDFYLFTAPEPVPGVAATSTVVTRYSPATKSMKEIAIYPQLIVGAGVSTCAPEK